MGVYLNPGNDGFQSAINSKIYVDKTDMLELTNSVLNTEQRYICVSRPRRFGKSLTAEMLLAYYGKECDSSHIFSGLKISKAKDYEKHLNQHDVLYVDVTTFLNGTSDAMDAVKLFHSEMIRELRMTFPKAIDDTTTKLQTALADINNIYGNKFIIIIDEWDAFFRMVKEDVQAQKAYIELLQGLFKAAPSKRFVSLAYITGILPIKKYGQQSALNNFDEYTMTNPRGFAEYVGFTEDEVRQLCQNYDMDFESMKSWYDGYSFRRAKHVYNPNSVVQAILSNEYDCYWSKTETYESLKDYISMNYDGLKDTVIGLLAGGHSIVNTETFENDMTSFQSRDDVLTVLIHLGYLAYDRETREVYIPNEEVRTSFVNAIQKSNWTPVIQAIVKSDALLAATWRKDAEAVSRGIDEVHMAHVSELNYNDENSLSCVITLAYYNAVNEYTLIRELPAGKGYADIVFLPRRKSDKPAMVVELKYDKSAEGAINQIKEKQYAKALEAYEGKVLLVGINYDKKSKQHECVIEEWEK